MKLRSEMWADLYWRRMVRSPEQERALKPKEEFQECSRCPAMVVVPSGKFMMGAPETEKDRIVNESPQHKVTISKQLAISKYEVTFEQWDACAEHDGCKLRPPDQGWGRGKRPVINVSWHDAQEYVAWLSKETGKSYRMLSEAKWEYAARAQTTVTGETLRFSFGNNEEKLEQHAWYARNSENKTQEVGKKEPNAFGLYDMHGNVWEWVEDCYMPNHNAAPMDGSAIMNGDCSLRVLRGGNWISGPRDLRSASREGSYPISRGYGLGFRVARTLAQ